VTYDHFLVLKITNFSVSATDGYDHHHHHHHHHRFHLYRLTPPIFLFSNRFLMQGHSSFFFISWVAIGQQLCYLPRTYIKAPAAFPFVSFTFFFFVNRTQQKTDWAERKIRFLIIKIQYSLLIQVYLPFIIRDFICLMPSSMFVD
jgi:hypothetical protein